MCGICGVLQLRRDPGEVVPLEVLAHMTDVMTHRGPDERGLYEAPGIGLGARRLSIVDVAHGHQPATNEDRSIFAIQNGELYNQAGLREQLAKDGHVFGSACDTDVIPHLYERYGDDFMSQLRGMFGIAVWDERRRRLVLARDRLGIKPLYYAVTDDAIVFGSEIKSILASGLVPTALDERAIEAFLTLGFVPGPSTLLASVRKLLPGERLVADQDGIDVQTYWDYPEPAPERLPLDSWRLRLLDALDESIAIHLMSDVPLGAMLSGGLDSSLIVGLMARQMTGSVKTFSIGFAGTPSELADAREVASIFGTDHHEIELPPQPEIDFESLVWHLDEPVADLSSIGFYELSRLAAEHVTVALSGQGADELLGGYSRYRVATVIRRWNRLPRPVRSTIESLGSRVRRVSRLSELARLDPVARFVSSRRLLGDGELGMVSTDAPLTAGADAVGTRFDKTIDDPLDASMYLDARLGLVDDMLHYFDRMSMAHSLEVRVPFLDHQVVELCGAIPNDLKVHRRTTKFILKEAARGLVPDHIIDKPKIGFFNTAVADWVKAATSGVLGEYLLRPDAAYGEFLDRGSIELLLTRQREGRPGSRESHMLLTVLMLEVWLSSYIPRATAPPARPMRSDLAVSA